VLRLCQDRKRGKEIRKLEGKRLRESKKKDSRRKEKVKYWLDSAGDDWRVAKHLFEKADYAYSLFFGHLTIEKMLKAIYADRLNDNPPFTHRLVFLAERVSLALHEEHLRLLETVTDFNLEARYPDEKFTFKKKCTKRFTQKYLKEIEEMKTWLGRQIK
jgi:HEPN domain-containing protein